MSTITFFPRRPSEASPAQGTGGRVTATATDWGQQEIAEFYRAQHLLQQSGIALGLDRGVTDKGDPWLVFYDPASQEVFVHVARIGARCVLVSEAIGLKLEAGTISDLIPRFEAAIRSLVDDRAARSSNVVMLPTARILLSIAVLIVLAKLQMGDAEAAAHTSKEADAPEVSDPHMAALASASNPSDDIWRKSSLQARLQAFMQRATEFGDSPVAIAAAAHLLIAGTAWDTMQDEGAGVASHTAPAVAASEVAAALVSAENNAGTRSEGSSAVATESSAPDPAGPQQALPTFTPSETDAVQALHPQSPFSHTTTASLRIDSEHATTSTTETRSEPSFGHSSSEAAANLMQGVTRAMHEGDARSSPEPAVTVGPIAPSSPQLTSGNSASLEALKLLSSLLSPRESGHVFTIDADGGELKVVTPGGPIGALSGGAAPSVDEHTTAAVPTGATGPHIVNSGSVPGITWLGGNSTGEDTINFASLDAITAKAGYVRSTHVEPQAIDFALRHVMIAFRQSEIEISAGNVLVEQSKAEGLNPSQLGVWTNTMADGSRLVIVGSADLVESFKHFAIG